MNINRKMLSLLGVVLILGSLCMVGAFSKPARISKSAASPEIQNDRKTTSAPMTEDLVLSGVLPYFPEKK